VAHEHQHETVRGESRRALAITLALTASFTVVEVVGGLLTGSLALLADAGHMLSDNLSLGVALFAAWLAGRPETPEKSFGYKRAEILAALANGVTLVAISIWIFAEAFSRLREPPEILGGPMLVIAALGLIVNVVGAVVLSRSGGESLNMQGALRHVIADALGSLGTIAAALVIVLTGWRYADPIASAAIAALILASSWSLLRDSTNILLEAAPRNINTGGRRGDPRPPRMDDHVRLPGPLRPRSRRPKRRLPRPPPRARRPPRPRVRHLTYHTPGRPRR
jgi:cobalt-zinc-cadmium efflux system protein